MEKVKAFLKKKNVEISVKRYLEKTHGTGCHLRRTESTPQFNHHRAEQTRYQWKV